MDLAIAMMPITQEPAILLAAILAGLGISDEKGVLFVMFSAAVLVTFVLSQPPHLAIVRFVGGALLAFVFFQCRKVVEWISPPRRKPRGRARQTFPTRIAAMHEYPAGLDGQGFSNGMGCGIV